MKLGAAVRAEFVAQHHSAVRCFCCFQKCPMFFREYERVRAGKPPVGGIDQSRYEPKQPTGARAADPSAWKNVVQSACCHLQHLDGK